MLALVGLAALINLALFISVLIKLFQNEGVGLGILGLICSLYTFIWGWMKHKELGLTKVMVAWSAIIVTQMILGSLLQQMAQAQMVP
ncbi:MAG: hypothetical protein DRI61_11600 [Chloroflexi bacterium]|nr:MAG: hypothetical protein DRI61_11600 [Chloroflexota bacterium]